MRKEFDNQKRLTGHDNDALYFRDDRSSCSSSTENIRLGPFIEFNELEKEFPRVSSQVPLSPRGDEDDRSYQFSEAEAERGTWTGKFDFLLSLLGYSVGLGNVWRFPYLCYRNGGGAFLIPFISMMLLAGLPLMFMELSFGQYASLGPIAIFDRFCPLFAGLGYGMVIVSGTVMLYYNMIIAWTIFYMFASWNSKLPWEHCDPEWSTPELLSENSAKHVLVVILLTVSIFSFIRAEGRLSLITRPAKEDDASSKRIFILADNVLDQKSFKIVPVSSTAINRPTSRRNGQFSGRFSIQKYLEQGLSRRVDEIPLKRKIKIASIPAYQQVLRRNENSNHPDIATVQRIKSSDGISAVPVTIPQKGNADSQLHLNNKYIQINVNADKNKLPTSDQNVKQSESLNEKQVNTIHPEASSVKKLTGWVYPLKHNSFIPVEASNPEPYDFGYDINDGLGSTQFRRESTNGDGVIIGNYGYKDYQGVFRHVSYVSDKDGFRAVVKSNEPGVLPVDSADVTVIVDPPPPFFISSKS